ncbi:RING/U-box superfamily protein [Striga asiatica]|uniref:RING/U-box superfamily protein n=1 Tax=Striga asiatica TaxID=4170 RepID=A0A5A7QKM7_STRAF|nr:RING/U-box superfamily protein [Striga asiatica]
MECGKPELRTEIDGSLFWVKDLLLVGGVQWDTNLIRALFNVKDATKILQIKSLNPRAADHWKCSFLVKGNLQTRGLPVEKICRVCGEDVETQEHTCSCAGELGLFGRYPKSNGTECIKISCVLSNGGGLAP